MEIFSANMGVTREINANSSIGFSSSVTTSHTMNGQESYVTVNLFRTDGTEVSDYEMKDIIVCVFSPDRSQLPVTKRGNKQYYFSPTNEGTHLVRRIS